MKNLFNALLKLVIFACIVVGGGILYKNQTNPVKTVEDEQQLGPQALVLKKYFSKFGKPQKIQIFNFTKRLDKEVEEIKKMKLPIDLGSKFYVAVELFTDENDKDAPLVAQIKFMDVASDNMVKEESINLD